MAEGEETERLNDKLGLAGLGKAKGCTGEGGCDRNCPEGLNWPPNTYIRLGIG